MDRPGDDKAGAIGWWLRRSAAQRVAVSTLAVGLVLSLFALAWGPESDDWRVLEAGERGDLAALATALDAQGIDSRLAQGSGDAWEVRVPATAWGRATALLGRSTPPTAQRSGAPASILGGGALTKRPTAAESARLRELRIQETIRSHPDVQWVSFLFFEEEPEIFETRRRRTASIWLCLEPGVDRLSGAAASSFRDLVSGALGIPHEAILVVDQNGNSYRPSTGSQAALDAESRIRRQVRAEVEGMYEGSFEPWEIDLAIFVNVDAAAVEVEELEEDVESLPRRLETESGEDGRTLRVSEDEVVPTRQRFQRTQVPPGAVEKVHVDLRFDLRAVKQLLARRREALASVRARVDAEDDLASWESAEERRLEKLLQAYPSASVSVSTEVFRVDRVATTAPSGPAPSSVAVSHFLSDQTVRAVAWWVMAGLVVLLLVLIASRRRRATAPLTPEVRIEQPVPLGAMGRDDPVCEGTLELTRRATRLAKERPDVAQSILKFWMAAGSEPPPTAAEIAMSRGDAASDGEGDREDPADPAERGADESSRPRVAEETEENVTVGVES